MTVAILIVVTLLVVLVPGALYLTSVDPEGP
jgi:hypothetical protein